jgi:hypothetical protein
MKKRLSPEQKKMIKLFEGYYGSVPENDIPKHQSDIEPFVKSYKQGLYMLLSDETITEDQYTEAIQHLSDLYTSSLTATL